MSAVGPRNAVVRQTPAHRAQAQVAPPPVAFSSSAYPPFEWVHRLGHRATARVLFAAVLAVGLHLAGAGKALTSLHDAKTFARTVRDHFTARLQRTIEVELAKEPEPEPEPEPEEEPIAEAQPEEPPPPPPPKAPPPRSAPPKPPAAAKASKVLAAEPVPDEPLDLTGNTFVQGNALAYAGGVSAAKGTSDRAVRSRAARPDGVVGGRGKQPSPGRNLSQRARPVRGSWNCPFPPQADLEQINHMRVHVVVNVTPQGNARSAVATSSPGFGFAKAAERCARRERYRAARDAAGKPVASTETFVVNFRR